MQSVRFIVLMPACLILLAAGFRAAAAADFPAVAAEEQAVTSVPGEPNAPAVVLFKKGEFLMAGYGLTNGSLSSSLRVQVRLKILTKEGKSNGEIAIAHSDFERLRGFKGRTVLPDGRIIPVSADAKFLRKTSRSQKWFTTAVAFPSVQVGAILDYQYELWFDSIYYLDPWYFSEEVPVRYAEIVFKTPLDIKAQAWSRSSARVKIQRESQQHSTGYITRAWAENLPSVPDDPYGPPYTDLAAQMIMLPSAILNPDIHEPLLESWPKTCELIGKYYDQVRRRDGGVAKQAREIAGTGSPRQQAEALYRFIRDQIETEPFIGVVVGSDDALAKVLKDGKGDRAEKALLLQAMLKAVKIDSRLVWAADRTNGAIDTQLPNPAWFDTVLVLVELGGERIFLDPSDRALGFGYLRPGYEGNAALIHDVRKPEGIVLPETPFDQNLQRAEVDLALDEKGRLSGTGTLRLTGHHAWEKIGWQDDEAQTLEAWKKWLGERYRDFQISEVKAAEAADERRVTVTWSMAQREEEVLGDETSVVPSAPLGPLAQPFVQPASSRRSAVMFDYPDREEVELRLRWPEGWKIEGLPKAAAITNGAGALSTGVEMKEAERTMVYKRRVDITDKTLETSQEYEAVRSLFAEVEKNDAQALLLVHR
ncbi:MAG TPA: DUF3857 domain-containing protein [Thermoanaerobaculia bacterium]|jgi:transglutaminase-like putative cysteine protease|nr:DUF3857 domain-containing protein [Thermoanaerobaculia bacterium]